MPINTNLSMIKTVVTGLRDLAKDVVFVGGAVTELYVPDMSQVPEIRQTDDVDCIIEIASWWEYTELENKLRALGFENDQKVICRWHYQGVIVDIMPTDDKILGFSNQWYKAGIKNCQQYVIEENLSVNVLSIHYFIACKLEALFNRGMTDLRLSKDLEDIVFLFNYADIKKDFNNTDQLLREYLSKQISILLANRNLPEAVFCVLPVGENSIEYVDKILGDMKLLFHTN